MDNIDKIELYMAEVLLALGKMATGKDPEKISSVVELIANAREKGNRVFVFGNGGSSSTASHFASDLIRQGNVKAISLTNNTTTLTAHANDFGYENIFKVQLQNMMETGDIAIAISCSGNSTNVIKALEYAREKKIKTVGFTNSRSGRMRMLADFWIVTPSHSIEQAEDIHLLICHAIATCLRNVND